ncbi:mitochondrial ribosomal protein L44 [Glarea lozoyensis ATCC 20868]|uniref:Large ribosomal subunit protein mL53 n=1 Tax=Glarea lozoyensis (strain ATCC 20868 / MF5171) TaxID=1116229 RepID=S3DRY1_GLAL2|nr:mitochondrial ribosomal protein L44 [Glarea lozoyensis ATCC 20868]EPE29208.1 mitochondrial ribosomal protein L44 [Glarea lozoyensis ATCC 20868]
MAFEMRRQSKQCHCIYPCIFDAVFGALSITLKLPSAAMITKFLTEVKTVFNPFSAKAKTARIFLAFLPPNARQTMKVTTKLLPRVSRERSFVQLKFKDGKELTLDAEKLGIKGVIEEVDRHSRILSRQEELTGN